MRAQWIAIGGLLVVLAAGCTGEPVSNWSTPTSSTAPITYEPVPVDPPAPDLVTADGEADLGDYWDCLDLKFWETNGWVHIGSASYDQATEGQWGPPMEEQVCDLVLRAGDPIRLPADAAPGTYRVMERVVLLVGVGSRDRATASPGELMAGAIEATVQSAIEVAVASDRPCLAHEWGWAWTFVSSLSSRCRPSNWRPSNTS